MADRYNIALNDFSEEDITRAENEGEKTVYIKKTNKKGKQFGFQTPDGIVVMALVKNLTFNYTDGVFHITATGPTGAALNRAYTDSLYETDIDEESPPPQRFSRQRFSRSVYQDLPQRLPISKDDD